MTTGVLVVAVAILSIFVLLVVRTVLRNRSAREARQILAELEPQHQAWLDQLDGIGLLRGSFLSHPRERADYFNRAIQKLQREGVAGATALAQLIDELVGCRSIHIVPALTAANHIEATPELIKAVRSAADARPATVKRSFHYSPEVDFVGKVGWSEATRSEVARLATAFFLQSVATEGATKGPDSGAEVAVLEGIHQQVASQTGGDPVCGNCGTVYNRVAVIRELQKIDPLIFEFAHWTSKFKCHRCRSDVVISA